MLGSYHQTKTFRGTFDEVVSHHNEIPEGAVVELLIYEPDSDAPNDVDAFGGKSVADMIEEIGFLDTIGPSDMGKHPEKYMNGFGETKDPRMVKP